MARRKKPEDAGKEADALIQKRAETLAGEADQESEDDLNLQDPPDQDPPEDDDGLNLLNEDEGSATVETSGSPDADYKQKYDVLQGKYNTEMGRMASEVSKLTQQNQQLFIELSKIKGGGGSDSGGENLNEDLKLLQEQYPAIYKGVMAVLRSESGNMLRGTEAKVDKVIQHTIENDRQRYFDQLDDKIPRWRAINVHPVFIKWLGVKDKYTGATRAQLLDSAYKRMDSDTTMTFFDDFMKEKGIKNQGVTPQNSGEIAPNTSGSGSVGKKTPNPGYVTRTEIKNFYKEKVTGRYRGTPEEAAQMEKKIFNALRDGHVLEK